MLVYHAIQHHDSEDGGQVHIRVPEKRARPLLGLIAPQANSEVDHTTAQDQGSGQVEVAHGAYGEEHEGDSQHEQRVEQYLPPCLRLALDDGQHGDARLFVVFLDQQT